MLHRRLKYPDMFLRPLYASGPFTQGQKHPNVPPISLGFSMHLVFSFFHI